MYADFQKWVEKYQIVGGGQDGTEPYCYGSVGPGWLALLDDLAAQLVKAGWDRYLGQVKEKFGGLRFYIGTGTQEQFDLISAAEDASLKICEECGRPGKRCCPSGYWMLTLCSDCDEKIKKEGRTFR
jgi:hypothetical protein